MSNYFSRIAELVDSELKGLQEQVDIRDTELNQIRSALGTQRRNRSVPAIQRLQKELAEKTQVLQRLCESVGVDNYGNLEKAVKAKFKVSDHGYQHSRCWDHVPNGIVFSNQYTESELETWQKRVKREVVKVIDLCTDLEEANRYGEALVHLWNEAKDYQELLDYVRDVRFHITGETPPEPQPDEPKVEARINVSEQLLQCSELSLFTDGVQLIGDLCKDPVASSLTLSSELWEKGNVEWAQAIGLKSTSLISLLLSEVLSERYGVEDIHVAEGILHRDYKVMTEMEVMINGEKRREKRTLIKPETVALPLSHIIDAIEAEMVADGLLVG